MNQMSTWKHKLKSLQWLLITYDKSTVLPWLTRLNMVWPLLNAPSFLSRYPAFVLPSLANSFLLRSSAWNALLYKLGWLIPCSFWFLPKSSPQGGFLWLPYCICIVLISTTRYILYLSFICLSYALITRIYDPWGQGFFGLSYELPYP